jgi:uncharacterized protein YecA (UPF0149 family)
MAENRQHLCGGDRIVEVYPKENGVAKLGTKQRPAVVRVQTEERGVELLDLCSDIKRILRPPVPVKAPPQIGRNDYCPCGSGKKYKKCCEGRTAGS